MKKKRIVAIKSGKEFSNPLKAIESIKNQKTFEKPKVIGICKHITKKEEAFKKSNLYALLKLKKSGGKLKHSPFKNLGEIL